MRVPWRRAEPVDVLCVCTGNLCRSPMIETLLSTSVPTLAVASAGTAAPEGRAWHPLSLQALAEAGCRVSGAARRLRARDVAGAALIITAEAAHRGVVVGLDPGAENRCFTLLEAQRLLQLTPVERPIGAKALAVHLAAALREHPLEYDDDLPDPIEGTINDFRSCLERVADAVKTLSPALA